MQADTVQITLSLKVDVARRLKVFAASRNGSMHNLANAALTRGLNSIYDEAPFKFQVRFEEALKEGERMADIVQALRDCGNGFGTFKTGRGDFGLCDDAADEIERLRAALASIAGNSCCDGCREAALVAAAALKEGE